jgi:hypothetical protein
MKHTTKRILFFILSIIFVLSACAPAPTAAPTQDPAIIQEQINEAVEATVAAQNAQATEQQALIVPTNTPLPTQTEVAPPTPTLIVLPTSTPFVIVPTTGSGGSSSGGGGSIASKEYDCKVVGRIPADNTIIKPNKDFDIKWTLLNSGTKAWPKGLDLKYDTGPKMALQNYYELPAVKPGEKVNVVLDAKSPSKVGLHVMVWKIEGPFCYTYVRIYVE